MYGPEHRNLSFHMLQCVFQTSCLRYTDVPLHNPAPVCITTEHLLWKGQLQTHAAIPITMHGLSCALHEGFDNKITMRSVPHKAFLI